ncbi:hypothetical protein NC653_004484 [Populus alba x Populus x berolinensis]|uniref:Uncharacterized protein n=1 Tax=Populus alba x Populus x berolinensis TaxID=444605 RepID=A0AAD6WJE1_9ROSI|nr:hypothetical protein NC653_004484 [Populus alba x Populus x berolinensis]
MSTVLCRACIFHSKCVEYVVVICFAKYLCGKFR